MPDSPTPKPRRKSLRLRLLVIALCSVVLLELSLHLFLIEDGKFRNWPLPPFNAINNPEQLAFISQQLQRLRAGDEESHAVYDQELGWTYRPSTRRSWGDYSSNSIGARGPRELAAPSEPGTTRILCFGDSFTYCEQVGDRETWPSQLQDLDQHLEVVNYGVGAYGTDQALLRFRRKAKDLPAQVMCLGLMLENINRNVNRYRPIYYPASKMVVAKPRFRLAQDELLLVPIPFADEAELFAAVRDDTVLERLGEHEYWQRGGIGLLEYSATARVAAAWFAYSKRQHQVEWSEPAGEPYRVTLAILAAFHEEATALGAELATILLFPAENDMLEGTRQTRYWQPLLDDLAQLGIPCLDLTAPLAQVCAAEGTRSIFSGGHLNARGNGIVAGALRDWVQQHEK